MNFLKQKLLVTLGLLLLLIGIPLILSAVQQNQETRSRASGSATLSLTPSSSSSNPIQKNTGETVSLDLMVDPGSHIVTFVRFQVKYDPTKLEPVGSAFTVNATAFPTTVEGPIKGSDTVAASVSIGADPTKAISTPTKVGTLTFKAIGATGGTPTIASFTSIAQVLSAAKLDEAGQNVLSTTTPAYILIGGDTITSVPSVPPTGDGTILSFSILLHGVGAAGDNPNPNESTLSNKSPLHPQRNLNVEVFNSDNQIVATSSAPVSYSADSGRFVGKIGLGPNFPTGNYNIKVKTDRYLRKSVSGIQQIKNLEENLVPETSMVAGDTNGDNILNVLDYNALLDCGYGLLEPLPMADPQSVTNTQVCTVHNPVINVDLEDNGIINSFDYNLFVRELSVQNGD